MRPLRIIGVLVAASIVLFAPEVYAGSKVAALVPVIRPNSTPELQSRFHEAITRGLQGPDADVIPTGEVRLRLGVSDELLNCSGAGICAARAATALKTDRVVATEISNFGKDYTIRVSMLDAAGREVARTEEPCDICTLNEADQAAAKAAARLMLTARTNPAVQQQTTPPPPQKQETPPAPPKQETPPPPEAQPAEPVPPGVSALPQEKKIFPYKWVGVGALVVGVVGIAIGAPLLAIDGEPTCDLPDPKHSCKDVYDTAGGGAALVTIGALGVAAGVSLIVVDVVLHKRAARHVAVAPLQGGAMLTSQWQF